MKLSKILSLVATIAIIIIGIFVVFKPGSNKEFDDLKIYKDVSTNKTEIAVSEEQKKELINLLKKEKFTKMEGSINSGSDYLIAYGTVEITFSNSGDYAYYQNTGTFENKNIYLSNNLKNYIRGIE